MIFFFNNDLGHVNIKTERNGHNSEIGRWSGNRLSGRKLVMGVIKLYRWRLGPSTGGPNKAHHVFTPNSIADK